MNTAKAVCFLLAIAMTTIRLPNDSTRRTPIASEGDYWVYIGSADYVHGAAKAIYVSRFDAKTGRLASIGAAAETINPGFLALHPSEPFLYAVNEIGEFQGQKNGAISSFRIDRGSGKLTFLNQVPALGANPAFVTVSKNGKFALIPSYYGGLVVRPIRADGSLGEPAASVQMGVGAGAPHPENSHPHAVVLSPDGRFAITPDLGLNRIFVFRFDEINGSLVPNTPAFWQSQDGSGPRHLAFTPDGRFAYALNETQSSLSAFAYNAQAGVLEHLQTISTLPSGFKEPNTGAEVAVSPSGEFVYASNRGHDSIAVFAIDTQKGTVSPIQTEPTQGKTPRNFALDPSGKFLLVGNQDSSEIVVFRVDQQTGRLTPTGEKVQVATPVCIVFARAK